MLRSPVLGLPLELDIGLLRQHYTLLRKRSSVVAVARRQIRDGVDIGGSALHGERYTRFFWNVLVFYDGSTGFAETLRRVAVTTLNIKEQAYVQGRDFLHAVGERLENALPLIDGVAGHKHRMVRIREQFSDNDTGITI